MGYVHQFQFSHISLLIFFVIPFCYYGYHAKYWYLPQRVKMLDFLLLLLTVVLCTMVTFKVFNAFTTRDRQAIELSLLHLGPLVLALLAIAKGKKMGYGLHQTATVARPAEDTFAPAPLNKQVEKLTWDDIIIDEGLKGELNSVITLLKDPKTARQYGLQVPKGILLNGPPGTGKTTIAKVIANVAGLSFFALRANEIVSKWVGESEKNLSRLFESASKNSPAVIFIDEVDSLGKKRSDANSSFSDNLLNHLLQLIDGVVKTEGLYIIAATNRADLVDEALKRPGRLDRVIEIPLPNMDARRELFELYFANLELEEDVDIEALATVTEGLSAASIRAICNEAGLNAYRRESASGSKKRSYAIRSEDVEAALEAYAPDEAEDDFEEKKTSSAPVPLNAQIEKLSWDDLIIDDKLKEDLNSVIALLKDPQTAKNYGIDVPKGILMNGPPGTGKTTIAKVIANVANLSFFVLQMDEIVSKWVGESEKNLTRLFKAAAKHAPSVVFIDEVDSIANNRAEGNAQHSDNLLNHLLQLIDGVIKREGIYVIAATNRADLVDPALKRGGRLTRVIEIPLPDFAGRKALFSLYLARLRLAENIDLNLLARTTDGKSGADIKEICNQAGLNAFKRESARGSREYVVRAADITAALQEFGRKQS